MEEKERYITLSDRQIKDTYNNSQVFMSIKNVCKLINQQDKRIKDLLKENQQLKEQLHDLPKKIVCEISEAIERLSWRKRIYTNWEFDKEQLYKDLDTILKKYGGENESKGDVEE